MLLLDADIELASGMVATLRRKLITERLDLVSIMAELRMKNVWEKLLVPAFVYFFRLLYPFSLGNSLGSRLGVAAGGCIFIRSETLRNIGGFATLRNVIIDDCTLAKLVKDRGGRTWVGLSHSVQSHRIYPTLSSFWHMVARSAFTPVALLNRAPARHDYRHGVDPLGSLAGLVLGVMVVKGPLLGWCVRHDALLFANAAFLPSIELACLDAAGGRHHLPAHDLVIRDRLLER